MKKLGPKSLIEPLSPLYLLPVPLSEVETLEGSSLLSQPRTARGLSLDQSSLASSDQTGNTGGGAWRVLA